MQHLKEAHCLQFYFVCVFMCLTAAGSIRSARFRHIDSVEFLKATNEEKKEKLRKSKHIFHVSEETLDLRMSASKAQYTAARDCESADVNLGPYSMNALLIVTSENVPAQKDGGATCQSLEDLMCQWLSMCKCHFILGL